MTTIGSLFWVVAVAAGFAFPTGGCAKTGAIRGVSDGGGARQPDTGLGSRAWSMAEPVQNEAANDDGSPSVAMNAAGDGMIAFQRGGALWARPYEGVNQRWGAPVRVAPISRARDFQVGMDGQGNALIVWARDDTDADQGIWSSRTTDRGATWSAPRRISAGPHTRPTLAVGPNEGALAAWTAHLSDNTNTVMTCDFRDGDWNTTLNMPLMGTDSGDRNPRVAVDGMGRGFVIWGQPAVPNEVSSVWTERYDGGWQAPSVEPLESYDDDDADTPSVALNETGAGMAIWQQITAAGPEIWARRFDGARWQNPVMVGMGFLVEWDPPPQVAIDPAGDAVAIWSQVLPNNHFVYDVFAARFVAGTAAWEAPQALETDNMIGSDLTQYAKPLVGMDRAGNALASWRKVTASNRVLVHASQRALTAATWSPVNGTALYDDGVGSALSTDFAVSRDGTAIAAWTAGPAFDAWVSVYR